LIERRGGKVAFVQSLEAHFQGGHNEHSNEVRWYFYSRVSFDTH
jgi:hypothetical protein